MGAGNIRGAAGNAGACNAGASKGWAGALPCPLGSGRTNLGLVARHHPIHLLLAHRCCRMLFGWKAAENLKTTRLSYQPTTAQWKRYFDRINRSNTVYLAPAEEAEAEAAGDGAAAAAAAVAFLPLAFVLYRVLLSQAAP